MPFPICDFRGKMSGHERCEIVRIMYGLLDFAAKMSGFRKRPMKSLKNAAKTYVVFFLRLIQQNNLKNTMDSFIPMAEANIEDLRA